MLSWFTTHFDFFCWGSNPVAEARTISVTGYDERIIYPEVLDFERKGVVENRDMRADLSSGTGVPTFL